MNALDAIEWEACVLEPVRNPEAERFLRQSVGFVSPGARYFLDSPWLTHAAAAFDVAHFPTLYIDPNLAQMIALVVSQENSCRYCYTATRSLMNILGFPEARIRYLEGSSIGADLTAAERAALEFARCVARATPLATCKEGRSLIAAGYTPSAAKEIAFTAAANVFFNRLATLPALPPAQVEFPTRWYARFVRPLMAAKMRPRRATQPEVLRPEQREGPFAAFVNALDGLPAAPRLRAVIDEALQVSTLSRRVKGLVFAVVARGLDCPLSEREAARILADEGMAPAQFDHALAHLSGPDLDPLESAAVSLARESIWFQPAALQRHVRSIRPLFSRQQFVELIGIAALANTVCRLAVVVDLAHASD